MNNLLNIGLIIPQSLVNGPGKRFTIWFQGCFHNCEGCFNKEFHPIDNGTSVNSNILLEKILSTPNIEGVSFTGGEPFLQTKELLHLSKTIKEKGLSLLSYSGYTMHEIKSSIPGGQELLQYLDILIDGPYVESQKSVLLWRGSLNQKVHFLSDHYKHLKKKVFEKAHKEVELCIGHHNMSMTGFYDQNIWEMFLTNYLSKQ